MNLVDAEDDSRTLTEQLEHPAQLFKSHWVDLVETHASVPLGMTATGRTRLPSAFDSLVDERERRDEEVRKIVEQYCACDSKLKELLVEKQVFGWRLDLLEAVSRRNTDPSTPREASAFLTFFLSFDCTARVSARLFNEATVGPCKSRSARHRVRS